MPALDAATGKLLLDAPGRLFTGPNGHGGTLIALADSGLLDALSERITVVRGIRVAGPSAGSVVASYLDQCLGDPYAGRAGTLAVVLWSVAASTRRPAALAAITSASGSQEE